MRVKVDLLVPVTFNLDAEGNVSDVRAPSSEQLWALVMRQKSVTERKALHERLAAPRLHEGKVRLRVEYGRSTRFGKYERSTKHHHIIDGDKFQRNTGRRVGDYGRFTDTPLVDPEDLAALNAGTVKPYAGPTK